jgi:hypothetical protein
MSNTHVSGSYRTSTKVRYGFDAYRSTESSSIRYIRYDTYRMDRGDPDPRSRSLTVSPRVLFTGVKPNYRKELSLAFGDYVELYTGTDNTSRE